MIFKGRNILLTLWFLSYPYYFFPSGYPQVADFFMFLYLIFNVKGIIKDNSISKINKFKVVTLFLVIVVFFVQISYYFILNEPAYIQYLTFYLYNLLVVLLIFSIRDKVLNIITPKLFISTVFILFVYYAFGDYENSGRLTLGFNNPNQLSLYVLLMIILGNQVFFKAKAINNILLYLSYFFLMVLLLSSLSKAGMVSLFVFIILMALKKLYKSKIFIVIFISSASLFLLASFLFIDEISLNQKLDNNKIINHAITRINSIGSDYDDSAKGRGYGLILSYPEYIIFGAGEGNNKRFPEWQLEIHSLFGNLLFSYGILGLSIFLYLLYILAKNTKSDFLIFFFPIFLLSLTHNPVRSRLFWVLLVLFYLLKNKEKQRYD